ncbi:MAG TPA: hypothetical protein PKA64_23540, partial [Myxococcota bacterium]|nr:hypothetical protein [Myxococcota bacterium]
MPVLTWLLLAGCSWSPGLHAAPAADEAFVRQAVPTLLGRKPYGSAELAALTAIAEADGRGALVDRLLGSDEFATHWANVLVDDMEVQLQYTDSRQHDALPAAFFVANYTLPAGPSPWTVREDNEANYCFLGDPGIDRPSRARLAAYVLSGDPYADPPRLVRASDHAEVASWRMRDLLVGALESDRIFAAWRAYAVAFVTPPQQGMRGSVYADVARRALLGADKGCTKCHSSGFSTTDAPVEADPTHDRFAHVGVDLDRSLLAPDAGVIAEAGTPYASMCDPGSPSRLLPPAEAIARARPLYLQRCSGCHGDRGELVPFGARSRPGCGTSPTYALDGDSGHFSLATRVPYLSFDELKAAVACMPPALAPREAGLCAAEVDGLSRLLKSRLGDQDSFDRMLGYV